MTYAIYEVRKDGEIDHDFYCTARSLFEAFHHALTLEDGPAEATSPLDPVAVKQQLQRELERTEVKVRHLFRPNECAMIGRAVKHLDDERAVEEQIKRAGNPGNLLLAHNRAVFELKHALARRMCLFSLENSRRYIRANNHLLKAVILCDEVNMLLHFKEQGAQLQGRLLFMAYRAQRKELEM